MAPMVLPDEIGLQMFGNLKRPDLKNARLVCKIWALFASESLFDKLYISPREEDIKVFESVTQHPQLRRCVKKLQYDASRFITDISEYRYFSTLSDQTFTCQDWFPEVYDALKTEHNDPHINEFINGHKGRDAQDNDSMWNAYQKCKDYGFIVQGYGKWQECAIYQDRCLRSGDFARILVSGLRNLDCLESVYLCASWGYGRPKGLLPHHRYLYNSPFGRTWSILHASPVVWIWEIPSLDITTKNDDPHGLGDFWTITTALALAQKKLRRFRSYNLSAILFDQKHAIGDRIKSSVDVYSGLQRLNLSLYYDYDESAAYDASDKLVGLHSLLDSSTRLRDLSFSIGGGPRGQRDQLFTLAQTFPSKTVWMLLTALNLFGISTSAKALIHLLTVRMPKLRKLGLTNIELQQGRWEGVIEVMRRCMRLSVFFTQDSHRLLHLNGQHFMGEVEDAPQGELSAILEKYIVNGGRHPCLLPEEPDSTSEKYISDLWL